MSLTGVETLFALPIVLVAYWLLPRRQGVQNLFLLACSLAFYASSSVRLLALLVGGTIVDWALARAIDGKQEMAQRRALAAISVVINIGILAWCKYAGFFADGLESVLGTRALVPLGPPLGMSFYTLQRVGYVLDVRDRRTEARASLVDVMLFSTWFPQITAGPISRAGELFPQLEQPRRATPTQIAAGFGAILGGLLMKGLGADVIGPHLVDPVFAGQAGSAAIRLVSLPAYAIQVFMDFAGYSLVAIGVSRLFGIELPQNFAAPFAATSLPELWRRWHISLNRWLFEYVYTPMVAAGPLRGQLMLGFFIVFLLSGAWHGATAGFLAWGLLHGLGMIVHAQWDEWWRGKCRKDRRYVAWRKTALYNGASWILTQGFFVASMLPFRAATRAGLARWAHGAGKLAVPAPAKAALLSAALVLFAYHVAELDAFAGVRARLGRAPAVLQGALVALALVLGLLFMPPGADTFIYRNF